MIQTDLDAANIPYRNDISEVMDFHSLRYTFASNLAKAGVAPKIAQELLRHSDVNLTLNIYTQVGREDLALAVEKLPTISNPGSATGSEFGRTIKVAPKVALKTGNLGNYQDLSTVSDDQLADWSDAETNGDKPQGCQHVTTILPAHKKEPPLGFEPRTYALRKRRSTD